MPDYQPVGPVIGANLVSPEAQLATAPAIIGFLNGASSLLRFGLTDCDHGFGSSAVTTKFGNRYCTAPSYPEWGRTGAIDGSSSDGTLTFSPSAGANASAAEVVRELNLLLTAGRLSAHSQAVLESAYEGAMDGSLGLYLNATTHTCEHWGAQNITSEAQCDAAARALGLRAWNVPHPGDWESAPPPNSTDDGHTSHGFRPSGCYSKKTTGQLFYHANQANRGACDASYICLCAVHSSPAAAVKHTTQLLMATPEFHTTNRPQPTDVPRVPPPPATSLGRPYKAIVVLFLNGGVDSWNLLVPHSGCIPGNASTNFHMYTQIRQGAALDLDDLHAISAPPGSQPHSVCSSYGIHPELPHLKSLYDAGEAAMLSNFGTLIEPLTKQEYNDKAKRFPPSLFAHNVQVKVTQSVHAQDNLAKGVLGRIVDVLEAYPPPTTDSAEPTPEAPNQPSPPPPTPPPPPPPYKVGAYSLSGIAKMLDGER